MRRGILGQDRRPFNHKVAAHTTDEIAPTQRDRAIRYRPIVAVPSPQSSNVIGLSIVKFSG